MQNDRSEAGRGDCLRVVWPETLAFDVSGFIQKPYTVQALARQAQAILA